MFERFRGGSKPITPDQQTFIDSLKTSFTVQPETTLHSQSEYKKWLKFMGIRKAPLIEGYGQQFPEPGGMLMQVAQGPEANKIREVVLLPRRQRPSDGHR